jgi:predicted NACHT family NTPase
MDENELVATAISVIIDKMFEKGSAVLSKITDKEKRLFKKGINEYLEKQEKRYSQIKTLLTSDPVDLYSIYYPLKLISKNGRNVTSTSLVKNVFGKTHYVTIIGDAGSGKSTLIKHLFLNSISTGFAIPILVELRYLNDYDGSFIDYVMEKSLELNITDSSTIFEEFLKNGKFVFFLDGYDELYTKRKHKIIRDIDNFVSDYRKNYFILTSRPISDIEQLNQFTDYYMKELSYEKGNAKNEIKEFIFKVLRDDFELASKVNESIDSNIATNRYIKEFLVNPLLLTLYILSYQRNTKVPDKKFIFYRRVIEVLFSQHDAKTKLGYQHEIMSGLNHGQMETVLRAFCILSFFKAQYDWESEYMHELFATIKKMYGDIDFEDDKLLHDFKVATALWLEDNGMYSFAHRSLQEYFSASFVKHLSSEAKHNIYKKINEKLSRSHRRGGVYENFLSLLKEMDTMDYYKFCYIPFLEELEKAIDNSSDEKIIKSFVSFLVKDYSIQGENKYFLINETVYKTIHIHLDFTKKLNNILSESLNVSSLFYKKTGPLKFKPIDDKFFSILSPNVNNMILKLAREYYSFIVEEKKRSMKYLKDSVDIDNELIEMI